VTSPNLPTAHSAQRKAETAERMVSRHQERVEVWENHVSARRPGSPGHRRAERRLRQNRKLRDRAQRRAARQRAREAAYRARAKAAPPAPQRPGRRRWQPTTALGKSFAASVLALGFVTGVAIGGATGFDPSDTDSQVAIEVDAPAPPVAVAAAAPALNPAVAPVVPLAATPEPISQTVIDDAEQVAEQVIVAAEDPRPEPTVPPRDPALQLLSEDCHTYLDDYPELLLIDSTATRKTPQPGKHRNQENTATRAMRQTRQMPGLGARSGMCCFHARFTPRPHVVATAAEQPAPNKELRA
jgi:hypothetical protein